MANGNIVPVHNIMIVEDHLLLRGMLGKYLQTYPEFHLSHSASSWEEAISTLEQGERIDLILIDLGLTYPGNQAYQNDAGLLLAKHIMENYFVARVYECKIILITGQDTQNIGLYIYQAFQSHIHGFLHKSSSPDELIMAFKEAVSGRLYYRGEINNLMSNYIQTLRELPRTPTPPSLSPLESEILSMIADGYSSKEMSKKRGTTEAAVEAHRRTLKQKLGAKNMPHAVAIAFKRGILGLHD